jgi:hypothetical protein
MLDELQKDGMTLSELVDIISFTMPLDLDTKQKLLAEPNVAYRAQLLIDNMSNQGPTFPGLDGRAPTNYSLN